MVTLKFDRYDVERWKLLDAMRKARDERAIVILANGVEITSLEVSRGVTLA